MLNMRCSVKQALLFPFNRRKPPMLCLTGGGGGGGGCNVAKYYTLLSCNWERIYKLKSPLFGSQEENPHHLSVRVTRIFVLFAYFFVIFLFSCEQKLCDEHKARRRTFQLTAFRQPSASVVSPSAASSSPRRSIQHQLKIVAPNLYGPSAEATYKFCCLSELLHLINFALILSLPLL